MEAQSSLGFSLYFRAIANHRAASLKVTNGKPSLLSSNSISCLSCQKLVIVDLISLIELLRKEKIYKEQGMSILDFSFIK